MMMVFPAYAGVFLTKWSLPGTCASVPRIRGGVPATSSRSLASGKCSPHTRGCSFQQSLSQQLQLVFPAYAGVFPVKFNGESV